MLEDKEGGRKFQLNFLVLFVTVMIESISNGPVNQKFLANIETNMVIHNVDWYTYTLDCLNESRKAWNELDPLNFYTDPLFFLVVFYMKSTMLNGQDKVCRIIPSMNRWTTNQLKDRQRKEVQNGGFGKVTFASKVQFLDDVENVEATKNEVAKKKMDTVIAAGTCKEMIHESQDMIGDEEPNDCGDEEISLEDIVNKDLLTLEKECDVLFGENLRGVNVYQDGEVTPEMVQDVVTKLDATRIKPSQKSLVSSIDPEPKVVKDDNKGNGRKQIGRPRSLNELVLGKIGEKRKVCFPIIQSGHFYYITFKLMKNEVLVIDNLTISLNYKELPEKLHHKAIAIGKVKPVRLEYNWQSRSNFIDCGIFLMRHMKIYKGMHKMEDGLAQEGFDQQKQLNDLRKKYATKILLADINKQIQALMRKVNIFDKLTVASFG
uniref:Ulp1 protease family, C-terminal catalytic domain-containing protein n=1 Tax=Tanacetum cinerariifolium TaxID=118510 RepID=A0A699J819_TANCI|nr:ulp1 protease family, C-terminal catalytic domain-containing protein [Tanacetum cinerariifolium]